MTTSRTVALPTVPARGFDTLRWLFGKSPNDAVAFFFDISNWLLQTNNVIAAVSAQTSPNGIGDLVLGVPAFTGGLISVKLSAGNPGTDYPIEFTVTMTSGETLDRIVWIMCQALSPNPLIGSPYFAGFLPAVPGSPLLGGAAGAFAPVSIGAGLQLLSGVLSTSPGRGRPTSPAGLAAGQDWTDGAVVWTVADVATAIAVGGAPYLRTSDAGLPPCVMWRNGIFACLTIGSTQLPSFPNGLPPGSPWLNGIRICVTAGSSLPTIAGATGAFFLNGIFLCVSP